MNCGAAAPTSAACVEESTGSVGARGRALRFAVPGRWMGYGTIVGAFPARRAVWGNPVRVAMEGRGAPLVIRDKKTSRHRGACEMEVAYNASRN